MRRIIVTGANGTGKSHTAARLAKVRPGVPVISFDALKLRTDWRQRPRSEIERALIEALRGDSWILEGGPSLLPIGLGRADAVVWLDPPGYVRAWRLVSRPWKHRGRTRPELPPGNIDRPWQQYRFAVRSLRRGRRMRADITEAIGRSEGVRLWHCRRERDVAAVIRAWTATFEGAASQGPE